MDSNAQKRAPFSEREFYLAEFRGRTLAVVLSEEPSLAGEDRRVVERVLADLAANGTRVIILGRDPDLVTQLSGSAVLETLSSGWVGAAWRHLQKHAAIGLVGAPEESLPKFCSRVALELKLAKLVWLGSLGVLSMPEGRRRSLVDLDDLAELCSPSANDDPAADPELLREIQRMIAGGVASVSACLPGALADELFTYVGSGTFYSPEGYTQVRTLALDEFDAAENLIQRGIEEGYLLFRSEDEIEIALTNGFGAFVEGRYLAGIGALLPYPEDRAGEIASLYALTRFLGEGVGAHLLRFAVASAKEQGMRYVFACTTSSRVEEFFQREGFRVASPGELPEGKWNGYSADRLAELRCFKLDLG
jgi:N-acetylglutamate synthase-like GNAT family acetyltransferase